MSDLARVRDEAYLVGYWPLNGNADDYSGRANNGTWAGTPAYVAGPLDRFAGSFNGSDQSIAASDIAAYAVGSQMTVSWIMERDVIAVDDAFVTQWDYATDGAFNIQSGASASDEISVFIATSATDSGIGCRYDTTNANEEANIWYHVVVVFDGSLAAANRIRVYQNGVLLTGSYAAGAAPATVLNSAANFCIGNVSSGLDRDFPGTMSNVRYYNVALGAQEALGLYRMELGGIL
jgi:hypothetical protein